MAGSLNKTTLIGNVGRDPEFKQTNESKEICTFTIATTETWKDRNSGEKKERTEWHRIVVFSEGLIKVIKDYVKKGSKLYIEGSLQTRKWLDNSGQEKYTTEIVLQNFNSQLILLDAKNSYSSNNETNASKNANAHFDRLDDDIPF